jgi:hypothetical protein
MSVPTLADFLLARIAEDEAIARAAMPIDRPWVSYKGPVGDEIIGMSGSRVLAECEAKRRIVELHPTGDHDCPGIDWRDEPVRDCPTLRALALPYAGHPAWREEWRP